MAKCSWCKESYWASNDDAGTYKESFCSEECETEWEDSLSEHQAAEAEAEAAKEADLDNTGMLVTFHYHATWGSGKSGGVSAHRDDDLESLKSHLAKYAPNAKFIKADCYDYDGKALFSYSDSDEAAPLPEASHRIGARRLAAEELPQDSQQVLTAIEAQGIGYVYLLAEHRAGGWVTDNCSGGYEPISPPRYWWPLPDSDIVVVEPQPITPEVLEAGG